MEVEITEEDFIRFFTVLKEIYNECKDGNTKGRTYNEFIAAGISADGMKELKKAHYITWHSKAKEPVWIAWRNPLLPDNNVFNLLSDGQRWMGWTFDWQIDPDAFVGGSNV